MGRRREPEPTALPPIPRELLDLIHSDGSYRFRGFVEDQEGNILPDPRRNTYKKLKADYCAATGIRLLDFSTACHADPRFHLLPSAAPVDNVRPKGHR